MIGSLVSFRSNDGATDFFLNDQTSINSGFATGSGYYIQINQVDGLYGSDISYESDPLPQAEGEISGDVFRRGKSIAVSGLIWSNGLVNLDAGSIYLNEVFWEVLPRKLIWTPLNRINTAVGTTAIGTNAVYVTARVNNDLIVSQALSNFTLGGAVSYPWTVGLRCDDPRIYNLADDTIYQTWQT